MTAPARSAPPAYLPPIARFAGLICVVAAGMLSRLTARTETS